jgi:hypothetical protein
MALQTERENRGLGQVYASDVPRDTHFMAGKTATFDRCMNRFFFGFVLVALEALCRVDTLIERNRMLTRENVSSTATGKQDSNRQIAE